MAKDKGDRHRNPYVAGIRGATRPLRDQADAAAQAAGYADLSAATVAYWRWLIRQPGAGEPRRPQEPAVVARQLLARLAEMIGELDGADPAAARMLLDEAAALGGGLQGHAASRP